MPRNSNAPKRVSPHPADFPLGSPASRAATRLLVQWRESQLDRVEVVCSLPERWGGPGPEPPDWNKVPRAGPWQRMVGGKGLMRVLYFPRANRTDEARQVAAPDLDVPP
jgi:hypothetical protein